MSGETKSILFCKQNLNVSHVPKTTDHKMLGFLRQMNSGKRRRGLMTLIGFVASLEVQAFLSGLHHQQGSINGCMNCNVHLNQQFVSNIRIMGVRIVKELRLRFQKEFHLH